jgi:hypothetical protein
MFEGFPRIPVVIKELRTASRAKRRANRRNAQKATGPRTPQGKLRSSQNATAHGIFCRRLVLNDEDERLLHRTRASFLQTLRPQDEAQLALVETMVAARWRINRCLAAEADLFGDIAQEMALNARGGAEGSGKIVAEADLPRRRSRWPSSCATPSSRSNA